IPQVYLREFSGGSWQELAGSASGTGISHSVTVARAPTLAYQGGSLFAAWQDNSTVAHPGSVPNSSNYWEIRAVRYNGAAWVPAGNGAANGGGISNTHGSATQPKLASAGGQLFLLWADDRIQNLTGNTIALYVKKWNGSAFVEEFPGDASDQGISNTGGDPQALAFAADASGHPFVAWSDNTPSAPRGRGPGEGKGPQIYVRGNIYDAKTVYYVNDP